MELKKLIALLVTVAFIGPAISIKQSQNMLHEVQTLADALKSVDMSETGLVGDLEYKYSPKKYLHDDYLLTTIVGYNDHSYYDNS